LILTDYLLKVSPNQKLPIDSKLLTHSLGGTLMIEQLKSATTIDQGLFVAATGLIGVFLVLVLFFVAIKAIQIIDKK